MTSNMFNSPTNMVDTSDANTCMVYTIVRHLPSGLTCSCNNELRL